MKKILLIEDDVSHTQTLLGQGQNSEYEVKKAYSYLSAKSIWEKYNKNFDCIVLDLNINPEGLETKQINEYFPICGMAFLDMILKDKSEVDTDVMLKKTIIYSGYIDTLKGMKQKFNYFNKLILIAKTGTSINKLRERIEQILKLASDNGE
jgi:CheY-like chemotaxis protein